MALEDECAIARDIELGEAQIILRSSQDWQRKYNLLFNYGQYKYRMTTYTKGTKTATYVYRQFEHEKTAFNTSYVCIERKHIKLEELTASQPRISALYTFSRDINKFWTQNIIFTVFIKSDLAEEQQTAALTNIVQTFKDESEPERPHKVELKYTTRQKVDKAEDFNSYKQYDTIHLTEEQREIFKLINHVALTLGRKTSIFKHLYINPVQISRLTLRQLGRSIEGAVILSKTDGIHIFVVNHNGKASVFSANKLLQFDTGVEEHYILEGELLTDTNIIMLFDVIVYMNDNSVTEMSYQDRAALLTALPFDEKIFKVKERIIVEGDPQLFYEQNKDKLEKMAGAGDGLIIYLDKDIYKWKPSSKITIDFYARQIPDRLLAKYGIKQGYYLFNYCNVKMIDKLGIKYLEEYDILFPKVHGPNVPIQFSPMLRPGAYIFKTDIEGLDSKVIELSIGNNGWAFERMREDKQTEAEINGLYGNHIQVAEESFNEAFNPLTMAEIFSPPGDDYFAEESTSAYKDLRKANSIFKAYWFNKYAKNADWLVDLAGGQGADINRYRSAHVRNVLIIDRDQAAIAEVTRRKYDKGPREGELNTAIYYMSHDISLDITKAASQLMSYRLPPFSLDLIDKVKSSAQRGKYMVDVVCCNMAIHYFMPTIQNFINLVSFLLKPDGVFFYTCFDGRKVFERLKSGVYEAYDGERLKYKISPLYNMEKETELRPGLMVEVLMPFSGGKLYEEPLVDIQSLNALFKGFTVLEVKPNEASDLSGIDKEYAEFYAGAALSYRAS
jgi:SAM-dependent methyltransferase